MKRVTILFLAGALALGVFTSGCCSHSGNREYIPGKGWVPTV